MRYHKGLKSLRKVPAVFEQQGVQARGQTWL